MRVVLTLAGAAFLLWIQAMAVFAQEDSPPPTQPRTDGTSVVWAQAGFIYMSSLDALEPEVLVEGLELQFPPFDITPDVDGDIVVWAGGEGCRGCGGRTVQVLNRTTGETFVAGGLAEHAPAPSVEDGRVYWVGGTLIETRAQAFQPESIFIVDAHNPSTTPLELPSVDSGPIRDLTINGDRLCWLESGGAYTLRFSDRDAAPLKLADVPGYLFSCSVGAERAVLVSDSRDDHGDGELTITAVDLTTNERRTIISGDYAATGNHNGYVFWGVDNPRRQRGYDPVANRIFELSPTAGRGAPYAENGVLVWGLGNSVAVRSIAELADAHDRVPSLWQRHGRDNVDILFVVGIAAGCLLLLAVAPGPPALGTAHPSSPELWSRWFGLAGFAGAVLMLVLSGLTFTRREFWYYEDGGLEGPFPRHVEKLLYALVLLLVLAVVSGLQWRQRRQAGATGWVGYAITTLGISLLLTTALDLRDGRGGLLLGILLLGVGLITLGCAAIDGEAPVRWRPLPVLLGLLSLITLPFVVLSNGHYMTVAFLSPLILAASILFAMLGYSVATARPAGGTPLPGPLPGTESGGRS